MHKKILLRPLRRIGWTVALSVLSQLVHAQSNDVTVQVVIVPPYTPQLTVWRSDPSRIQVFLTNNTSNVLSLRLSGHADGAGGKVHIVTKDDYLGVAPITLHPHEFLMLNGNQLALFKTDAVTFTGTDATTIERTGMLPDGTFEICLRAMDYAAPHTSRSLPMTGCSSFELRSITQPQLLTPFCGMTMFPVVPQSLIFAWTQPAPPTSASINYDFVLVEIPSGKNPNDAFQSRPTPPFFEHTFVNQTTFLYGVTEPPLVEGRSYAWRVQAIDPSKTTVIENNGASVICYFTYGVGVACSNPTISVVYPPEGERIPYRNPPVIVRFEPYCSAYRQLQSLFVVAGGPTESLMLHWPNDPLRDQRIAQGNPALTQEQAQEIWIGNVDQHSLFSRDSITWGGAVTLTGAGVSTIRSVSGGFQVGMGAPQLHAPFNEARFDSADVDFNWLTANPPIVSALRPTDDVVQYTADRQTVHYRLSVNERWVLEVSHTRDLSNPVWSMSGVVGDGTNLSAMPSAQISSLLYKTIDQHHLFSDTGDYYWRVKWLVNPVADSSDDAYGFSEVHHFVIASLGSNQSSGRTAANGGSSASLDTCIRIGPDAPKLQSTLDNGSSTPFTAGPAFAVTINPTIRFSAVNGGKLQIWIRTDPTEDTQSTIARTPVFEAAFAGHDATDFQARVGTSSVYDLSFLNTGSARYSWIPENHASYVWRFTLSYDPAAIRSDGIACAAGQSSGIVSTGSSLGTFMVESREDRAACYGECAAAEIANKTIGNQTIKVGDDLQIGNFILHVTSAIGTPSSLTGSGTIEIGFLNRLHLLVDFTLLKINAQNQVYEGSAYGHWDDGTSLPPATSKSGNVALTQGQINALAQAAGQPSRLISQLSNGSRLALPIGVDTIVGGQQIVIGVVAVEFTPKEARLTAVTSIPFPFLGPNAWAGLAANNICITPGGISGDGYAMLYLADDVGLRQGDPNAWGLLLRHGTVKDEHSMLPDGTFVKWSCGGFESFQIVAFATFPRNVLLPVDASNAIDEDPSHRVTASFSAVIDRNVIRANHRNWGFIAPSTIGRFVPVSAPEFVMESTDLTIDESDDQNPRGMTFSEEYAGNRDNLWRGFYLRQLSCTLPSSLRTFRGNHPITVSLKDFLIDDGGLNGDFRAAHVIAYPDANFGSWRASIDTFACLFVSSTLKHGTLAGRVQLPICDSAVDYVSFLGQANGKFTNALSLLLRPRDTLFVGLWAAKMLLDPTSTVELGAMSNGTFSASATLSGELTISGNIRSHASKDDHVPMNLRGLRFEDLRLTTQDPYIINGPWSFASEQHSAVGFPLSLMHVGIARADRNHYPEVGLQFNVAVDLAGEISGATTISLWGNLAPDADGGQHFLADGLEVADIPLRAELGAVDIQGALQFHANEAASADGFKGAVRANFLKRIPVDATGSFSSVAARDGMERIRCWYVNAEELHKPIVFLKGLTISGCQGGAWYHLAPAGSTVQDISRYTPDSKSLAGLQLQLVLQSATPQRDLLNADLTLNAGFLAGGGLGRISLDGNGSLLGGPHEQGTAPILTSIATSYDYPKSTLHGQLRVVFQKSISALMDIIHGDSLMEAHFEPDAWYLRMGTPNQRVAAEVGIASAKTNLSMYLRAGSFPLPGQEDARAQDWSAQSAGDFPNYSSESNSAQGEAMQLGGGMEVSGSQPAASASADIDASSLFDIPLQEDTGAHCLRPHAVAVPVGLHSWWAKGNFYTYVHAVFRTKIDVQADSSSYKVFEITTAEKGRGAFPNPTWVGGEVIGRYNILSGLVPVHCLLPFRFGDECELAASRPENPFDQIHLITDLKPDSLESNVDVFANPHAAFSFPFDTPVEVAPADNRTEDQTRILRLVLKSFSLTDSLHAVIPGRAVLDKDGLGAAFYPRTVLHPHSTFSATVRAGVEEFVSGRWQPLIRPDHSPLLDSLVHSFTTGSRPARIPNDQVACSYPLDRQRFFLQSECREGWIALKKGMGYLLEKSAGPSTVGDRSSTDDGSSARDTMIGRFVPLDGGHDTSIVYLNLSDSMIRFTIPVLRNQVTYAMQIIREPGSNPIRGTSRGPASTVDPDRDAALMKGGRDQVFNRSSLPGCTVASSEQLIYVYHFRTSRYDRLSDKLQSWIPHHVQNLVLSNHKEIQTVTFRTIEPIDRFDAMGYDYQIAGTDAHVDPLITLSASDRSSAWHTAFTNPWIYDPLAALMKGGREQLATPADDGSSARAGGAGTSFELAQQKFSASPLIEYDSSYVYKLEDSEIQHTHLSAGGGTDDPSSVVHSRQASADSVEIRLLYRQGVIIPEDFERVQKLAAQQRSSSYSSTLKSEDRIWLERLLVQKYQPMPPGPYTIRFKYGVTGGDHAVSANTSTSLPQRDSTIEKTFSILR